MLRGYPKRKQGFLIYREMQRDNAHLLELRVLRRFYPRSGKRVRGTGSVQMGKHGGGVGGGKQSGKRRVGKAFQTLKRTHVNRVATVSQRRLPPAETRTEKPRETVVSESNGKVSLKKISFNVSSMQTKYDVDFSFEYDTGAMKANNFGNTVGGSHVDLSNFEIRTTDSGFSGNATVLFDNGLKLDRETIAGYVQEHTRRVTFRNNERHAAK